MINPNGFGLACAFFALVAFFVSHALTRKLPWPKRAWVALASLFLALPGASFAAYYAHLVPVPT